MIYGINLPGANGTRRHAERVAIDKYTKSIGEIPAGSIIVTTCSPCNSPMDERYGESCKDLLNSVGIHKVYAGYQDPTQHDDRDADFRVYVTENDQLWGECQLFAQTFLGSEELAESINPDILNPNFQHRQEIDGFVYTAESKVYFNKLDTLKIRCFDSKNDEVASVLFEVKQGKWLQAVQVIVEPEYRSKGLANNMYAYAKMLGNTIKPSGTQTDQGKSMWAKWGQDAEHLKSMAEENELDEDWRSALATGAMAGAMAMGASAKVPEIVRQAVEPGDTVYSIARQNNVSPIEIFKLNKMDRNTKLEIGQRVLVPDYSKPAAAKSTAKPLPTRVAQPTTPKVSPALDSEVTLLSMNSDAEAALQTAAKAAGLKGVELAQFMAQTRHESWDFSKMKEVGNKQRFAKYDKPKLAKQLGNKVKGDGELFKGRGFIQLTGRDNYTRASKQIFGDDRLVKNPDLASRLDVGAQIALWFWKNQVRPNVKNFNNTTEVVKAINAAEPTHVVQQRHNKFKEYLAVL